MTEKIDKSKQEKIHNIAKNITKKKQLNNDGMFAVNSRVVGLRIKRMC